MTSRTHHRLICTCGRVIRRCCAREPYEVIHQGCSACKASAAAQQAHTPKQEVSAC